MCVFAAASRRGRAGRLGVCLAVRVEVPLEAEEDGQLQETQMEVPHGAVGEDGTCSHLCPRVFSGETTRHCRFISFFIMHLSYKMLNEGFQIYYRNMKRLNISLMCDW